MHFQIAEYPFKNKRVSFEKNVVVNFHKILNSFNPPATANLNKFSTLTLESGVQNTIFFSNFEHSYTKNYLP